ncbi:hypothetical protein B1B_02176 [mine drainage metagenome]|uniref:Glyoxalase-like domain-containing protein n=1 Tax=mine drainage metagenome TaxID=410659 RepID=T1CYW2_9ZZZZ
MGAKFQLVIDCTDPVRLPGFWAKALGYQLEAPPKGFATWGDYYRDQGVQEDGVGDGVDSIVDPEERGPRIWFHKVLEGKRVKNRLHIDITVSAGRADPIRTRKTRVDAEAGRLAGLGAKSLGPYDSEGLDHYAVELLDPEGNEFDIN